MMITTDNLWLRIGPGMTYDKISLMNKGTPVIPLSEVPAVKSGAFSWQYVVTKDQHGWCADKYLSQETPRPIDAKRIGLHIDGGPYGNLLDVFARLHQAGRPIPLATIINHQGLPAAIKRVSPTTVTIFRPVRSHEEPNPAHFDYDARGWWEYQKPLIDPARANGGVDYYQLANEWWPGNESSTETARRWGQFYIDLMNLASAAGIRITVGDIAVGNVEKAHAVAMSAMFTRAQQLGCPLNYHAYSSEHYNTDMKPEANLYAMRFKEWLAPYPNLKVVLGEAGHFKADAASYPSSVTLSMMQDLNVMLADVPQVIGAAFWTVAPNPMWKNSDITPFLPDYEAWMKGG